MPLINSQYQDEYRDPLIFCLRAGTPQDPYEEYSKEYKIINGMVILDELPVMRERLHVVDANDNKNVYYEEENKNTLTDNTYTVNYTNKIVNFHSTQDGKWVHIKYFGRGVIKIPLSSVYYYYGDVETSLNEILNKIVYATENFIHLGGWNGSKAYRRMNIVKYQGSSYMYVADVEGVGIPPTNETYWKMVAQKGDQGANGLGLIFVGDYDPNRSYNTNEVCQYQGKKYHPKVSGTKGVTPTDTNKWYYYSTDQIPSKTLARLQQVWIGKTQPPKGHVGLWIESSVDYVRDPDTWAIVYDEFDNPVIKS